MDAEFVVVGGGVMGLATAWRLCAAGHEVLLIEQFSIGHEKGSSHGATRIFRYAYEDPLFVKMAQEALPLWKELEGGEVVRIMGGVDFGNEAILSRRQAALSSSGAESRWLDPKDMRREIPWLNAGGGPGLWSPDTGVIAATDAVSRLEESARAAGCEVWEETKVGSIEVSSQARLTTSRGEVRAPRCILTVGAWAGPLLSSLGIELPLTVLCQQVFYFAGGESFVPFIHWDQPAFYGVPPIGKASGLKVAAHAVAAKATSADDRTFEMDQEAARTVKGYVSKYLPEIEPNPVSFETCLYTMTPNEDFIIDIRGPLMVISACSGHGFKFAPLIGEIAARLATDKPSPTPLDRFRISEFEI